MKRAHLLTHTLTCLLLAFSLAACAAPAPTSTPAAGRSCGDNICEGPENADNCPADCASASVSATAPAATASSPAVTASPPVAARPGETFITYVASQGIGNIAVRVTLPQAARYPEGAPVSVYVSTFFTPERGFQELKQVTELGFIEISYLWPGDADEGVASDGEYDYGGEASLRALKDVLRFALGGLPDSAGRYLAELSEIAPLSENVGLYAFSHPGIAATNVLALFAGELADVAWFVGRENPTVDTLSAVEAGYFGDDSRPVLNPYYRYPDSYSSAAITLDYSTVRWGTASDHPYFDVNGNGRADSGSDHILGDRIPSMFGKHYYSRALTAALRANGALTDAAWPADLATPEETAALWPFRETVRSYSKLNSSLRITLVFARNDHVQPALDKPHIHQAYDGFTAAGIWVRLNPDRAYTTWLLPELAGAPDNPANTQPGDWEDILAWAHPNGRGAVTAVPLAAVAEMADRAYTGSWDDNLSDILVNSAAPALAP